MDFVTKMETGMALIAEACSMNEGWGNCPFCPFIDFCDAIEGAGLEVPEESFVKE